MKQRNVKIAAVAAAILSAVAVQAQAAIVITEVAPWSSGNSPVGADWFELTNTGSLAVNISGWKVDDNSASFAASLALTGVSSIAAGQSVIFIESTTPATTNANFISNWFGTNAPIGLTIGNYSGSAIGLSTAGDAVNIYDGAGALQANVTFSASDAIAPYQTFDNAAGLTGAISQLSVAGVNGAFVAANDLNEIGSPGTIAPVPEPSEYAMMLVGLAVVGAVARRRKLYLN